jgi:pSer/pThr/pTyr-binding forkhead associated (FHA) protein
LLGSGVGDNFILDVPDTLIKTYVLPVFVSRRHCNLVRKGINNMCDLETINLIIQKVKGVY